MNIKDLHFQPKNYKEYNLTDLIILAQNDDLKALEEIIKRVQNDIYATLCYLSDENHDILDLTQDVLIKMSGNIKKLKNPSTFKSWLNQITMRVFYDFLRKKNKKTKHYSLHITDTNNENFIYDIPDNKANPDNAVITSELDKKIKESIYNLSLNFRIPIILRELHGMSYDEIAQALNTNIGTVKSRIARARNQLQEQLKPYIGEHN